VGLTALGGAGEITAGVLLLRAIVLVPVYNFGA
jgi:hypothetical protein